MHPDDEFHPPTSDDPYWTETCWFTFTVPERRLSGQLYPFFRTNQGVRRRRRVLLGRPGRPAVELPVREELLAPADPRPAALRHHAAERHPLPVPRAAAALRDRLRRPRRRRRAARRRSRSPRSRRRTTSASRTSTSPAATRARSCCAARRSPSTRSGSATARGARARSSARASTSSPAQARRLQLRDRVGARRLPHDHDGLRRRHATRSTATCCATASGRSWRRPPRRVVERDQATGYPRRVAIDGVDELGPRAARRGPLPEPARRSPSTRTCSRSTASPSGRSTASPRSARTTTTGAPRPFAAFSRELLFDK